MKNLSWAVAAVLTWSVWAGDAVAQKTDRGSQEQPSVRAQAYLGVGVEPLHSSLINRIASLVGGEYGVLVDEVEAGSPAEAAGLKPDDVIFMYDDQKVFNAEQLVRLVRSDKPGREVTLGVIRDGKKENINATLGGRQVVASERRQRTFKPSLTDRGEEQSKEAQDAQWVAFDALTLTRNDDSHFTAEIQYRNEKGKIVTRKFQGTHDEIANAIAKQKDMPAVERNHLLRALDMPQVGAEIP